MQEKFPLDQAANPPHQLLHLMSLTVSAILGLYRRPQDKAELKLKVLVLSLCLTSVPMRSLEVTNYVRILQTGCLFFQMDISLGWLSA